MRLKLNTPCLLLVFVLVGCGASTPECSDKRTTDLALKGFLESLDEALKVEDVSSALAAQLRASIAPVLSTIRVAAYDETIKKYSCDANLEVRLTQNAAKVLNDNVLMRAVFGRDAVTRAFKVQHEVASSGINYTSQLTEDKKQHIVRLQGHAPLAEALARLGRYGAMDPTGKALTLPPIARECDDPAAKQQLLELIEGSLAELAEKRRVAKSTIRDYRNTVTISFDAVNTIDVKADLSYIQCKAILKAALPQDAATLIEMARNKDQAFLYVVVARGIPEELALVRAIQQSNVTMDGNTLADDIDFRSSVSADKQHFEMYVKGHTPLLDLVVASAGLSKGVQQAQTK